MSVEHNITCGRTLLADCQRYYSSTEKAWWETTTGEFWFFLKGELEDIFNNRVTGRLCWLWAVFLVSAWWNFHTLTIFSPCSNGLGNMICFWCFLTLTVTVCTFSLNLKKWLEMAYKQTFVFSTVRVKLTRDGNIKLFFFLMSFWQS